jgi:hypothetical protein
MATASEIAVVRANVNEPDETRYSDAQIDEIIEAYGGNTDAASSAIWRMKAGVYADLADVQEGSSRRSLGDLHEQALAMANTFAGQAASGGGVGVGGMRPGRTRPIERP